METMHEPKDKLRNYSEVVLTGGPAAGKSSSLAHLAKSFQDRGIRTLMVPEVATILISGGLSDIGELSKDRRRYLEIQRQMLLMQRDLRRRYQEIARAFAPDPVVIVYDRAELDIRAYIDGESYDAILAEQGLTMTEVRDSYDGVIHLRTSALGAAEHYTTANNVARRESAAEAVIADARVLEAWLGSPHLWIVPSYEDFEAKREHVFRAVAHACGLPAPVEIERKFLLAADPDLSHPLLASSVMVEIEQTYLTAPDPESEIRVRRRSLGAQATYFWTCKRRLADGSREEDEALLSPSEYLHMLADADPERAVLKKRRYCFVEGNSHFELDAIPRADGSTMWLLEAELLHLGEDLALPSFLEIEREVTGDPDYDMANMAAAASRAAE